MWWQKTAVTYKCQKRFLRHLGTYKCQSELVGDQKLNKITSKSELVGDQKLNKNTSKSTTQKLAKKKSLDVAVGL